jgi:hypothetical protein
MILEKVMESVTYDVDELNGKDYRVIINTDLNIGDTNIIVLCDGDELEHSEERTAAIKAVMNVEG